MSPPIVTDISCGGTNDGSIDVVLQCPSTFLWNDGSTVGVPRTGLSPGTYGVTITDNLGVTPYSNIVVTDDQITYSTNQINNPCLNVCSGYASVNASSPSGVSYLWSNGATTNQITNLCDGIYSVTITNGSGCTKFHSFTITMNPLLNQEWPKNTMNVANQNDNVKRVLTDKDGSVYVMGEFDEVTEIEGNIISSGGVQHQKGIFLVKYNSCGVYEWMVHMENTTGPYYDIDAFDLDFNANQTEIVVFAKWDNIALSANNRWFSSNGSSGQSNNSSIAKDVFTVHVNTSTANFATINDYALDYNDIYTSGKVQPNSQKYIGGQIGGFAVVKSIDNTNFVTHSVIADQSTGNIVSDFEVHEINGTTHVYAAVNLLANVALLYPTPNTAQSGNQGDALIVKAPVQLIPAMQQSPSYINPAHGSNVLINDLEVDVTANLVVTAVGVYTGNVTGWFGPYHPPTMNIRTALVAQFSPIDLGNYGVHHIVGNIDASTAIAVSISPNIITVTGTMEGHDAEFLGDGYSMNNNTGSGLGLNSMWVAQFSHTPAIGSWFVGSQSNENVTVNDISYNAGTELFYVGGNYKDDLDLPPYTNLHFPTPGLGQEFGFIVRGGEDSPGQGAYYKTSAPINSEKDNTVLGILQSPINVYPNPNNGAFTLEFTSNSTENIYVKIFSITGSIMFSKTIEKTNSIVALQIQPTRMSSGLYTIQILQDDKISYKKFTVK